jgi:triacylglycerol esterase/lipase EstA (alpha/beta hydrolase family)
MPGSSRLARLLQVSCVLQLCIAAAWLAWRWAGSPGQAVLGALLVPMVAPLVLGIELLVVRRVARTDPGVPVPAARQLLAAWGTETLHWFRTFWWRQPFRWRAVDDHLPPATQGRTPVVFVHGFMCNRGFWTPWMRRCRELGIPYVAVNLEPVFASIDHYAAPIEGAIARVERAGRAAPVLVCHSMGGLAARAWWSAHGTPGRVASIVTIGTPHAGTWLARFSRRANGRQMQLGSAWLARLAATEARRAPVPLTCWYSNCDNVVFPASTATLARANNRFVPGQPHVGLAFHPEVVRETLALVQQLMPSR